MSAHRCTFGLFSCPRHPKWMVTRAWLPHASEPRPWEVHSPGSGQRRSRRVRVFASFAEAIAWADREARRWPCAAGRHTWVTLTNGTRVCAFCGVPR